MVPSAQNGSRWPSGLWRNNLDREEDGPREDQRLLVTTNSQTLRLDWLIIKPIAYTQHCCVRIIIDEVYRRRDGLQGYSLGTPCRRDTYTARSEVGAGHLPSIAGPR